MPPRWPTVAHAAAIALGGGGPPRGRPPSGATTVPATRRPPSALAGVGGGGAGRRRQRRLLTPLSCHCQRGGAPPPRLRAQPGSHPSWAVGDQPRRVVRTRAHHPSESEAGWGSPLPSPAPPRDLASPPAPRLPPPPQARHRVSRCGDPGTGARTRRVRATVARRGDGPAGQNSALGGGAGGGAGAGALPRLVLWSTPPPPLGRREPPAGAREHPPAAGTHRPDPLYPAVGEWGAAAGWFLLCKGLLQSGALSCWPRPAPSRPRSPERPQTSGSWGLCPPQYVPAACNTVGPACPARPSCSPSSSRSNKRPATEHPPRPLPPVCDGKQTFMMEHNSRDSAGVVRRVDGCPADRPARAGLPQGSTWAGRRSRVAASCPPAPAADQTAHAAHARGRSAHTIGRHVRRNRRVGGVGAARALGRPNGALRNHPFCPRDLWGGGGHERRLSVVVRPHPAHTPPLPPTPLVGVWRWRTHHRVGPAATVCWQRLAAATGGWE